MALEDRAKQAESLLGHPVFGEAARGLRERYLTQIENIAAGETTALTIAHIRLKVLIDVISELQSFVNDYKFAAKRQKDKAKAA